MTRLLFTILLSGFAAGRLQAEAALSLGDAIDRALKNHPALAAARERVNGSRQWTVQAGLRPNPRLFLQSENVRAWGNPGFSYAREADTFVYASQIVETAGKRERRQELAAAGVQRAEVEQAILERQIAGRVANAYWTAVGAERTQELLGQELANLTGVVDYTRSRVQEGAAPGVDLLRMELEHKRVSALQETAAQDAVNARIQLFREMSAEEFPATRLSEEAGRVTSADVPDLNKALEMRPEVLYAERAVAQSSANLRLQQANARPDLDIIFGYKRTLGFSTVVAGVQVPLAIFNRNQGQIGAATAESRAAEWMVRAAQSQVRAEWTAAQRHYESRRSLAVNSFPEMVRRATELARIAEAAYREGAVDVVRLLDAQRARIETQLMYSRALIEYQQSVVNFKLAAGVNP